MQSIPYSLIKSENQSKNTKSKDLFIPYTLGDGSFLTALISTILVLKNSGPVEFNSKPFLFSSPNYENHQKYEYFTLLLTPPSEARRGYTKS